MPSTLRATTRRRPLYDIGEGRSKCIYIEPEVEDTAVLLAFYNPVPFKRILKNIRYILQCLKGARIPYFVAECVFPGRRPQLHDADLTVHSNSFMFYKEQLLNLLEKKVPEQYTKLVLLDGDILFDAPDWINQISVKQDRCDILQPFMEACWLTPDNTRIQSKKYSYGYAITHGLAGKPGEIHQYHPGFAWAMRRETFRDLGGFYPRCIIGNGDISFAFNFFMDNIPQEFREKNNVSDFFLEGWTAYHDNFRRVAPSIGYLQMKALHLFHGLRENRQYRERYVEPGEYLKGRWEDGVTVNEDGLTEFRDPRVSAAVLEYFRRRNEDIPLKEAMAAMIGKRKSRGPATAGRTLRSVAPAATASPLNLGNGVPDPAAEAAVEGPKNWIVDGPPGSLSATPSPSPP